MKVETTIQIMLVIVAMLTLFHLGILLQIIPFEIVWGGRLQSVSDMYRFESFSLAVSLFFGWLLLMKGGYAKQLLSPKVVTVVLWLFFVLFALSTVGNILAKTTLEKGFTIITVLLCILIWRVNTKKDNKEVSGSL